MGNLLLFISTFIFLFTDSVLLLLQRLCQKRYMAFLLPSSQYSALNSHQSRTLRSIAHYLRASLFVSNVVFLVTALKFIDICTVIEQSQLEKVAYYYQAS
ncbi:MAG: hypothetical protein ACJA0E_000876 [Bermanella sp.]|jgi:hypothetical protein